jgi:nitrate/TMAO reductase-like tetraheme cytochrome c subunit
MLRVVKIVVAVVVTLLCVATMGVLAMRDASRRPEYCNTCHVVQPYYETWVEGDLLAHEHQRAGIPCQTCHPQDMQALLREQQVNLQAGSTVMIVDSAWADDECLACHGDVATLAERTQALDPNPHASPHLGEVECVQCHRMHKTSEYACAECHEGVELGPGWTAEVTQPLDIQVWAPDMDCTTCHSMEPYVQSLEDSNLLAYTHVQEGLECEDCHEQEAIRQTHEEIVPGQRVSMLTVQNSFCFDCHVDNEHASYEQVIERTMDYTVDGQQINPHDPHANVKGMSEQYECTRCHQMHKESPLIQGCYSCHHSGTLESCTACHE